MCVAVDYRCCRVPRNQVDQPVGIQVQHDGQAPDSNSISQHLLLCTRGGKTSSATTSSWCRRLRPGVGMAADRAPARVGPTAYAGRPGDQRNSAGSDVTSRARARTPGSASVANSVISSRCLISRHRPRTNQNNQRSAAIDRQASACPRRHRPVHGRPQVVDVGLEHRQPLGQPSPLQLRPGPMRHHQIPSQMAVADGVGLPGSSKRPQACWRIISSSR